MGILMWEKPAKIMSETERAATYVADSAPPGVYVPNMSEGDMERWKAKLVGLKTKYPRVEIRKTAYAQILIIVSLGQGFKQQYKSMPEGTHVQISSNGAFALSWDEWNEMQQAIQEAREKLEALCPVPTAE